jgi:hypothetical protein
MPIDVEIDKLTNSIENVRTGEVFDTVVMRLASTDRRLRKKDWRFNWRLELADEGREVHALTTVADTKIIQGLISIEGRSDHVFVHLVENARFNQGRDKVYQGVAPNLFAFACLRSFEMGHGGVVSFVSKTALKAHYAHTLGATIRWRCHGHWHTASTDLGGPLLQGTLMKAPIKEPLNVDLEVVPRELTPKEAESLRAFLKANKAKAPRKRVRSTRRTETIRKAKA